MKDRIIELADQRGEFMTDQDGYVKYWPKGHYGFLSEENLLVIAAELRKRNEWWDKQVNEYFDNALKDKE
jgi:hypothetical protein